MYRLQRDLVEACYPAESLGGWAWLRLQVDGVDLVLVSVFSENRLMLQEGNAALAMETFGAHPRLLWWQPARRGASSSGSRSGSSGNQQPGLLPSGWSQVALMGVVALAAVAIWRGRRLGPIIVESLPVIVPASETVEGHGRLYARIGARERAGAHLRAASQRRLSRLLGHGDQDALITALGERTGRDASAIQQLLVGRPPSSDADLVHLKRELDQLEQEARQL